MANAAGFVQESIWRDEHWRKLSRTAQATYMQLLSQKELDCAGVLPLQPNKWAKGCDQITSDDIWADLEELQRERFVFFDHDTDEVFVRSYIRRSNVLKVPNMVKSALRAALLVGSELIRSELAAELLATGRVDAAETASQISPSLTVPEGFQKGSNPSVLEPFDEPTGVGTGVGTGVTSRGASVGETPPKCPKHSIDTGEACWACKRVREYEATKTEAEAVDAQEEKRRQAAARRRAIDDCLICDEWGKIEMTDDNGLTAIADCRHAPGVAQ